MRERFRTFDSKITFFAFADIITAVSGMLVFITLLLATDLGRPVPALSHSPQSTEGQQLQDTLSRQADVDTDIDRLQALLAAAESAPSVPKLQADVAALQAQLTAAQQKQTALDTQVAGRQAAVEARDQALGLTDLKSSIHAALRQVQAVDDNATDARAKMNALEQQIARAQSVLAKLKQRKGQLWLIPDRTVTTKEPILVTVAGSGISIARFNRATRQANASDAGEVFSSYLSKANSTNEYVVFLIKPSGVFLFQSLVQSARDMGFNVGYDALEEDRQVHFSTPPPINEPSTSEAEPAAVPVASTPIPPATAPVTSSPPPSSSAAVPAPPPPKEKSWWERFLEWLGLH